MSAPYSSVLITGASSGIGAALAEGLAASGVHLALGGRDKDRLAQVAERCRAKGAEVELRQIEVTDEAGMTAWVREVDARKPLDLVIANAGIGSENSMPGDDMAAVRKIYAVNVIGALNTAEPALPAMRERGKGQVVLVASLAGMIGVPGAAAYSGSKAALIRHGQSWRRALAPEGVVVSVVCPGYIRTPMTARHSFPMPFLMDADQAARLILDKLAAGRGMIAFPWPMVALIRLSSLLPEGLVKILMPTRKRK